MLTTKFNDGATELPALPTDEAATHNHITITITSSVSIFSNNNLPNFTTPHSTAFTLLANNIHFIFDELLILSHQICFLFKATFSLIREHACILDFETVNTLANYFSLSSLQ